MAIQGPLREMGIHDVFQLLDLSKKTGVLEVHSELRGNAGTVHFRDGSVVFAELTSNPHRLGELLLKSGRISREEFEWARELQESGDARRFGEILVGMGADLQSDIDRQVFQQVEEVVFEMMSWREGTFSFAEGDLPRLPWQAVVRIPTDALLMNGARRIDEWSRIEAKIPDQTVVPRFNPSAIDDRFALDLFPAEWEVLAAVNGSSDVAAISDEVGQNSLEVARVLYGLENAGLITFAETPAVPDTPLGDRIEDLVESIENAAGTSLTDALAAADRAIETHPGEGVLLLVRGRIFRDLERWDEAENDYREALRCDPLLGPAHRELGETLAGQGRHAESLGWLERWLATGSFAAVEPEEVARVEQLVRDAKNSKTVERE